MKTKFIILPLFAAMSLSACALLPSIGKKSSQSESNTSSNTSNNTSTNTGTSSSTNGGSGSSVSQSTGPTKVTVPAHTLSDSNPPINVNSKGQTVSESTWNSFRNASMSAFNNNYNYTYYSVSGGYRTIEKFTKNGYYVQSYSGELYYERKSGSTFYEYIAQSDGYLRQETTLDLQYKYTYRIHHEIYLHMFEYSDYEYDSYDGCYWYSTSAFASVVKFQNGYLTYLHYGLSGNIFDIELSFETTIDIPTSYYYQ